MLVHFNPDLEIRLACDASDYGIGTVLSQIMTDGSEKPVGFVSRTLTDAEKYSQLEKEGLACSDGRLTGLTIKPRYLNITIIVVGDLLI